MHSDPKKLLKKHAKLTHSEDLKVISHNQRKHHDWYINSLVVEGCEIPFKFRRRQKHKTINPGQRVNMTYYPEHETIAGLQFDYMKVVRIKLS